MQPRIHRSWFYALARAWATVIQLDLQVAAVISDLYAGRPVAYTTFLAYDEVAHHSGVERQDTMAVLRKVDRQLGRIARAAAAAPRPYEFVVLADHGQSQGATFLQRYDESLEQLVTRLCEPGSTLVLTDAADTGADFLDAELTGLATRSGAAGRTVNALTRSRRGDDGEVTLTEGRRESDELARKAEDEPPEIVVMASGNLGHVTFPREPGRVSLERLEVLHPALLHGLRHHPGIAFALVRSEQRGAVVLGADGANWLDEGVIEGEDPLAAFGPNAADHVRRTDRFSTCPDVVAELDVLGGHRRGRGVRGARRLARRHGRRAVAPVPRRAGRAAAAGRAARRRRARAPGLPRLARAARPRGVRRRRTDAPGRGERRASARRSAQRSAPESQPVTRETPVFIGDFAGRPRLGGWPMRRPTCDAANPLANVNKPTAG